MSRSNYSEDWEGDGTPLEFYRNAVGRAMNGRRGQAFFREMLAALDAMPVKRLIDCDLEREDGSVCAIGAVGKARGIDMTGLDPEDAENVGAIFKIAPAMVREIVFFNDDEFTYQVPDETPERRWQRMRDWVAKQIILPDPPALTSTDGKNG